MEKYGVAFSRRMFQPQQENHASAFRGLELAAPELPDAAREGRQTQGKRTAGLSERSLGQEDVFQHLKRCLEALKMIHFAKASCISAWPVSGDAEIIRKIIPERVVRRGLV